jgi:predicted nucleic acid-binding Zn ribbon protein
MASDAEVGAKAPTLLPKGSYECPKCGNMVEVFIRLTCPPECVKHSGGGQVEVFIRLTCPPECVKHSGGGVPMSRRKK